MARRSLLVAMACVIAAAPSARAVPIDAPVFTVNGSVLGGLSCGPVNADDYQCSGPDVSAPDGSWTLGGFRATYFDTDNAIGLSARFSLRNDTAAPETFHFTGLLALAPELPWLFWNGDGYVGGVLMDLGGDGASFTDAGSPIFAGTINGSPIRTLLAPPISVTAGAFGETAFGDNPLLLPLVPQPTVSIGVDLLFTLSPGDEVLFDFDPSPRPPVWGVGVFAVGSPEPGTLLLVGGGLAGIAGCRTSRPLRRPPPPG